jgi:hypothetical protein
MNVLLIRHPQLSRAVAILWLVLSAAFIFLPILCLAAVLVGWVG